jgi:hypothetical protein
MQGPPPLLPYYQPEDVVVRAPVRRQRTLNKPLLLNRSAVKNMPVEDSYREILQNVFDAMVEVNGHRSNGIKRTQYTTPEGGCVTVFHTDTHILGEIVQTQTRVSFVNMGPRIDSLSQIIQTGASKKDTIPNQAGQHGEGLKRAALKLLTQGYQIDVWFPLCISNDDMAEDDDDANDDGDAFRTEMRHLVFTLHPKLRCLAYTLTEYRPTERYKGAGDFHRFQVDVSAGEKVPVFDLDRYMLPEALIKDPAADGSPGYVLLSKDARRNSVYVWHFYVVSYVELFYSYDMFMPRVARDRNYVPYKKLCEYVAKIWSKTIEEDEESAERFYNDILMMKEDVEPNTIELISLPLFSKIAAQRLYNVFRTKNPKRPVKAADWHKLTDQFDQRFFTIVPPHAMVAFDLVLLPLDTYLSNAVNEFKAQHDDINAIRLSPPPLAPRQLCVVYRPQCPVKYASVLVEDQVIILINLPPYDWESFWNIVLFDHLPKIYGSCFGEYFNGLRIATELIEQQKKALLPSPPAAAAVIVYADSDEEEEEERDTSNKRPAPVLPEGFEFYSGPPLIVKKQK